MSPAQYEAWKEAIWTARNWLVAGLAAGYAALVWRMAAQGLILRLPLFWSYTFLLSAKGFYWCWWHGTHGKANPPWFAGTETAILALKASVVLEAWWAVTREWHPLPRRRLFWSLTGAALILGMAMDAWPLETREVRAFVRESLKFHVGLATFCLVAMLRICWSHETLPKPTWPSTAHAAILTGHVCSRLTDLIPYTSGATEMDRWQLYAIQQFMFAALSFLWIALWWRAFRRD